MDYEDAVEVIFHGLDLSDNTERVTLKIPPDFDPEIAKEAFLDALWGAANHETVSKNEKENK